MEAFYSGTFSTETFYSVARQPYPVERQLSPIKSSFFSNLIGRFLWIREFLKWAIKVTIWVKKFKVFSGTNLMR